MNTARLEGWANELKVLVAEDAAQECEAAQRLDAAARLMEAAQEDADIAADKARSSRNALAMVTEQIRRSLPDSGEADADPGAAERQQENPAPHAPSSVAGVILSFLRNQSEATYGEITNQVRRMRPDVVAENCARDLGRLVNRGLLVRPRLGVYRLAGTQDEPMNS
ncbi:MULTISPECIES: hypothetical protein [Streptomyces]|uniref:Uncharacterized protein n=1 Tax=Streptomyces griseus subsp. griseus (strain JCM 4626 / CBS 651.72 / NBRC 13350 / KCC S-0626 / ISP 5235) TaxID=455632 RepID=B1VNA5_STRGG|nr:hypothetical protein [Streptomyces griseus]MBW3709622.1 hypothetical protein [Streptomyces griseus]SEE22177.1 hypothetical protein SAMN04490359_2246 [Streptomyces griseus]SQA26677.1 Uncharacterised protein [Streptomyces griseus]BAG16928.1 hypothetical protein SGR_99t [Streptomyces griseus subsp. griseus NBRC 13350]BAG23867.1 hypothetical protein SGR_7040t [Streptomyces griseus subsp. griseus NBRC 13350]